MLGEDVVHVARQLDPAVVEDQQWSQTSLRSLSRWDDISTVVPRSATSVIRMRNASSHARISAFLADWAAETGRDLGLLRQRASATFAAAAHRNRTGGSVDALLDVLRTFRAIPDFLDKT